MKRSVAVMALAAVILLSACAASAQPVVIESQETPQILAMTPPPTEVPTPTPEPTPTPTPVPQNRSITSGRIVPEGTPMRPFIMSIDNADGAKPQTSLEQADIIYEFLVEAAITRLQVLFNDSYPVYAGPLRSIRYYFYDLVQEWDAMYLGSGYVLLKGEYKRIGANMFTNNVNAAKVIGYKQDKGALNDYESKNGDKFRSGEPDRDSVHSMYIRVQSLVNKEYEHLPEPEERFLFLEDIHYENGTDFTSVSLQYASRDTSWVQFTYDAASNRLYRFEGGNPFINRVLSEDGTSYSEQQLSVQNLIVQHVTYGFVPGDDKGRRSCELIGEGVCDYFVNGQHLTGTWSRPSAEDYTRYMLDDGSLVTLEPGNTWISMHPVDAAVTVS